MTAALMICSGSAEITLSLYSMTDTGTSNTLIFAFTYGG